MNASSFAAIFVVTAAVAGCASVAVSDSALEQRTASALNLPIAGFRVSNRSDQGVKTSYLATTSGGQQFSCYVTGTVGITGRSVSDALCAPVVEPSSVAATSDRQSIPSRQTASTRTDPKPTSAPASSAASCNALLRAAGRCQ